MKRHEAVWDGRPCPAALAAERAAGGVGPPVRGCRRDDDRRCDRGALWCLSSMFSKMRVLPAHTRRLGWRGYAGY